MASLDQYQFELVAGDKSAQFGLGLPVAVPDGGFDPGSPSWRTQDQSNPVMDGIMFGRDYKDGPTWTWQLFANQDTDAQALGALAPLATAWNAREVRNQPGARCFLRYGFGGAFRRVYGRPRNFALGSPDNRLPQGYQPAAGSFQLANDLYYADTMGSQIVTMVPPSPRGLVMPTTFPMSSLGTSITKNLVATNANTNPQMETLSGGLQTVWTNYFRNPSFEVDTTGWAAGSNCVLSSIGDAGVTKYGSKACSIVPSVQLTGTGAAVIVSEAVKPPAGTTVASCRLWVRRSGSQTPATIRAIFLCYQGSTFLGQGMQITAPTAAGSPAAYNEAKMEGIALLPGTDTVRLGLYPDGATLPWPAGAPLLIDGAQLHWTAQLPPSGYFDGDRAAEGDFAWAWTGTPHASTSIQTGKAIEGYGAAVSNLIASSVWAVSGTQSARQISHYPSNGSAYVDIARDTGGAVFSGPLERGATYTIMVTCHLEQQITSPSPPGIQWSVTGMADQSSIAAAGATPGTYPLRLTFTVPTDAAATGWRARLYSNQPEGGVDVWWDDLLIVEGVYDGPYFDGSTPNGGGKIYEWTGPANASTSTVSEWQNITPPPPPRQGFFTVGGDHPAAPIITIDGPVTNPWVASSGWKFQLNLKLGRAQSVVIDTNPWALSILRDGSTVAGAYQSTTRLRDLALEPGNREIKYGGIDPTGRSRCHIQWRDTWNSLLGSIVDLAAPPGPGYNGGTP